MPRYSRLGLVQAQEGVRADPEQAHGQVHIGLLDLQRFIEHLQEFRVSSGFFPSASWKTCHKRWTS
jgi:hypothetical protein